MSGKRRIKNKKDGRGGARPGAGRPNKKITLQLSGDLLEMDETLEIMAKKHGYTIDQFLLAIVYKDKDILPGSDSIPLAFREKVATQIKNFDRTSKQEIEIKDKRKSPFNLPDIKEDPALKVVKGGKAEDDLGELIPVDGGDNCE